MRFHLIGRVGENGASVLTKTLEISAECADIECVSLLYRVNKTDMRWYCIADSADRKDMHYWITTLAPETDMIMVNADYRMRFRVADWLGMPKTILVGGKPYRPQDARSSSMLWYITPQAIDANGGVRGIVIT